jgi:hypothetical protein
MDEQRQRETLRLAMDSIAGLVPEPEGNVRSLVSRRAAQRYRAEHRFEPTRQQVEAIRALIWRMPRPRRG